MAQESRKHPCLQGRQPWIERDLIKLVPEELPQKFEGNLLAARIAVSEAREHFLEDGLHRIPLIFDTSSNSDIFSGDDNHEKNNFENGMVISVLKYFYTVGIKGERFQIFICVTNWEFITIDLTGNSSQLTNINCSETAGKLLERFIMDAARDKNSASQLLLSQITNCSENLCDLVSIANQTITCSQSHQTNRSLDISCHHTRPFNSHEILPSSKSSVTSSSNMATYETKTTSLAPVTLTSNEPLPDYDSIDIYDSLNTMKNVWLPNQDVHSSQRSNISDVLCPSSIQEPYASELQQNNQTFVESVAEEISPTQLLELMVQETQQNFEECGQEKLISPEHIRNHAGTSEEKGPPVIPKAGVIPNVTACELATPTFQDLFVPSDQRRSLALIQGWYLNDDSSQDSSSSSPAFLLSSSRNSNSSHENILLQPTMKDYKKHNQPLTKISSISDHLVSGLMKENCLENSEKCINDKWFSHHLSHELKKENCFVKNDTSVRNKCLSVDSSHELMKKNCFVNNETDINGKFILNDSSLGVIKDICETNGTGELSASCEQNSIENELSKNNSEESLFSDVEQEISSLGDNLENYIKHSKTLMRQKDSSLPCPELNDSVNVYPVLESKKNNILNQSCNRVLHVSDNVTGDSLQFDGNGISQMDAVECLVTDALNAKCEPRFKPSEKKQNSEILENNSQGTKSDHINYSDTDQSSCDFIHDSQIGCSPDFLKTKSKQQSAEIYPEVAVMSNVIDLSSTDDIYMIAGHEIDSFSDNLVSSSETVSSFLSCKMSTQIETHAPNRPKASYFESLSTDEGTEDSVFIHDYLNNQDFASSTFMKKCKSPEITAAAVSDLQDQTSCVNSQEAFSLNSLSWHSGNEHIRNYASCDFPVLNSDIAQLGSVPLSLPKKSITNGSLKITVKNIAAAVNKGIHHKTQVTLPNKELELEEVADKLEISNFSMAESTGKDKKSLPYCSCSSKGDNILPYGSKLSHSAFDPLTKEVRVLVTDIMKGKRSLLSNGQIQLSKIFNNHSDYRTVTKKHKHQMMTSDRDEKIGEKKNPYWTRSQRSISHCQQQNFGKSVMHKSKKHFSTSITEVGQHDQNVLEIKQLSDQSPYSWVRNNSSLSGNIDSRKQLTKINRDTQTMKQHDINRDTQTMKQHDINRDTQTMKQHDINRDTQTMKQHDINRDTQTMKQHDINRDTQTMKQHDINRDTQTMKQHDINRDTQTMKQYICSVTTNKKDTKIQTWRNPKTKLEMKRKRRSGSRVVNAKVTSYECDEQKEVSASQTSPSLSPQNISSLFSLTSCNSISDWRNVAPVLTSSCELETSENQGSSLGQGSKSLPVPFASSAAFNSQGFVPCVYDDDVGNLSTSSVEFEIETAVTNSDNRNLQAYTKLDQSVASIVNFICYGKFL